MANPITSTPTLYGEDAKFFLEQMEKPLTQDEIDFINEVRASFEKYGPVIVDYEDTGPKKDE